MSALLNTNLSQTTLTVAARPSPLSRNQVKEIQSLLPNITLVPTWIKSYGDADRSTSLRDLGQSDFFTREVDQAVLDGLCDIAVHSAKDLPATLPEGLELIALTKGVDPSDSLVLSEGSTLESLKPESRIATSSKRREEACLQLRSDLQFCDVRGTIEERLALLHTPGVSGVVIAEAALIRLGLESLNRITLPGSTVPGQGQLAIVSRQDNTPIKSLFAPLDSR